MKKVLICLMSLVLVFFAVGAASAVPTTWTDAVDFDPDILIPPTYYYYHDIGRQGFESYFMNPTSGNDWVYAYDLEIALYDDNEPTVIKKYRGTITIPDGDEAARIWTSGGIYNYDFSLESEVFTGGLSGVLDILADGRLGVAIQAVYGDFYLDYSILTAYGDNGTAPVPEPATLLLLGSGLVGVIAVSRKKFKK